MKTSSMCVWRVGARNARRTDGRTPLALGYALMLFIVVVAMLSNTFCLRYIIYLQKNFGLRRPLSPCVVYL